MKLKFRNYGAIALVALIFLLMLPPVTFSATAAVRMLQTPGLEPETVTQYNRIVADGGVVVDHHWMNRVIRTMKELGIYTSCKFLGDANFAYKNATGVTTLYDISGNNNDVTQTTGGNQPVWTAAQQNGRAGLVFDGSNDTLGKTFGAALNQPNTLVAVAQSAGDTTFNRCVLDGAAENRHLLYKKQTTGTWSIYAGSAAVDSASTTSSVILLTAGFNGASSEMFINSSSVATGNPGANTLGGVTIGSARNSEASSFFAGNIYSGWVFNTALSTAQRQAVETLLNSYYAIY